MGEIIDLGSFLSHVSASTGEDDYRWRLSPVVQHSKSNQLAVIASHGRRDDFSVVEVGIRKIYENKKIQYSAEKVCLAVTGDNKSGNEIYNEVGLSMSIIHVVEITSLTFYRERELTPIHHMILDATKVKINFLSPFGKEWPKNVTWSRDAYNYGDLLCERQKNITEDQQRRIEGLVIAMISNKPCAQYWLSETKHEEFSGKTGWEALRVYGFNQLEKHICCIDRRDSES